ncbi:hypothetical protein MBLNU459_g8452t1 [Dothideomycetes sp. NU459]
MLDENLPAFFYKKSPEGIQHHTAIFLSHHGSDPEPAYSLRHADPSSPNARNRYAAALFDSYNPEVLYGEVLVTPEWTQPSLSQEDIRRNNGIPPPPSPILPTEFVIQLYNPDQQVTVVLKPGTWGGSASYEFSLPQTTFRTPSASNLDRTQHDPAASLTTPKINFVWRKESKLAKDLTCFMTGKSTDAVVKRKHRDPDIAVALFRSLRELTVYEPNLYRIELEDPKGLELVLLLSAATIKDLYFASTIKEVFNVADPPRTLSGGAGRKPLPSTAMVVGTGPSTPPLHTPSPPATHGSTLSTKRKSLPRIQTAAQPAPPPVDPRVQWEIDAETARLRAQVEAEERERRRQDVVRRREREKAEEEEMRRLRKMVEAEEREARRKQEEVDRETARLQREYGLKPPPLPGRSQRHSAPTLPPIPQGQRPMQPQNNQYLRPSSGPSSQQLPPRGSNGLYLQPDSSSDASTSVLMSGANPGAPLADARRMKKKSFFGLRSVSDDGERKLQKKASAMW